MRTVVNRLATSREAASAVEVIDVLVHQPVTQPPRAQPFLGVADDPEALGAVDVLDRRPRKLSRYAQKKGQEPVAQGILQAGAPQAALSRTSS